VDRDKTFTRYYISGDDCRGIRLDTRWDCRIDTSHLFARYELLDVSVFYSRVEAKSEWGAECVLLLSCQ
jgi:hypothetical protein